MKKIKQFATKEEAPKDAIEHRKVDGSIVWEKEYDLIDLLIEIRDLLAK